MKLLVSKKCIGLRSYSVMVITKDFESFDPGSSPGRTLSQVPVAQLDKASDYESEDWGFKSLQGYVFVL